MNGDRVNIITSKNTLLHCIGLTIKTGKARAAIRRYWHDRGEKAERIKIQHNFMDFFA